MSQAALDRLVGQVIAERYQVVRIIGRGGMGTIYEVQHVELGRAFALKTMDAAAAEQPEALARFQREADVVASLRHPNVVQIVDWETLPDGTPCIIMELLQGEDLAARLERGPLPWPEIARVADATLSALAVAHQAGIVHRDLKPNNLFLARDGSGEEHVKLLDFGISKVRDGHGRLTTDQQLLGTPLYMSPEQADARPDEIGPATDVWAMAAILYEMATGQPAFDAPSVPAILYRICHGAPDPIEARRADAPAAFLRLIRAALSHEAAERICTAEALRVGLRAALGTAGADNTAARPLPPARPTTPSRRRRSRIAVGVLGAVGVAAAIGAGLGTRGRDPHPTAPRPPVTIPAAPLVTPLVTPPSEDPGVRTITVRLSPAAARLELDSVFTGPTLQVPRDGLPHRLHASLAGYHAETLAVDPDGPDEIEITLRPRAPHDKEGKKSKDGKVELLDP